MNNDSRGTIEKVENGRLFPLPDEHWVLSAHGAQVAALSLWWKEAENFPSYPGQRLGLIGHFSSNGDAGPLIEHACRRLAEEGCTLAIAPIDCNTFFHYRFVIERGEAPLFFLEPDNPPDWPVQFENSGFKVFSTYCSSLGEDLNYEDPRMPAVAARMDRIGVTMRALDASAFDDELAKIYEVSAVAFKNNLLYAPIPQEVFSSMYRKVQSHVDPGLVTIAEHEGRPVGFLFALPDYLGEKRDSVIIKSIAVIQERRYAGLGGLLWARTRAAARERGYSREIHALMHEGNDSLALSNRNTSPFRRYALFARAL